MAMNVAGPQPSAGVPPAAGGVAPAARARHKAERTRSHPLIVGVSPATDSSAVAIAERLAGALSQPLVLTAAYRYTPVASSARATERALRVAEAELRRVRRLLAPPVDAHDVVIAAEDAGDALTRVARELDASLVVVGTDRQGHVARNVVQHATCPVVVGGVRATRTPGSPRRIGAAYDGSEVAGQALAVAVRLALLLGAHMTIATVGATDAHLDAAARSVRAAGIEVDVEHRVGDPAACLLEMAQDLDLVACGARSAGSIATGLLGSVSRALVAAAACPVLVVPAMARLCDAAPLGVTTAAD